jgi:cytochrome c nitrite reductase small subunit
MHFWERLREDMSKIIAWLRARPYLLGFSLVAMFGIITGLGIFTFYYAQGASYLSDDPQTCINCHIMREQFEAWGHSSHRNVATCNDCHTPHGPLEKWFVKALNGWNHSVAFTTGDFHEPIRIKDFNADITQRNCVTCHEPITHQMRLTALGETLTCTACHGNVGHGNRLND